MHQVKKSMHINLTNKVHILLAIITILLINLVPIYSAVAGTVILSWDPPTTNADGTPLTDLAGYKVYYGTASRTYGPPIDVGNVTTYTIPNLSYNVAYYFAVTAYDVYSNESVYSSELVKTIPDATPPTGTISIDNGATSTTSVAVTLTLSCSDATSGCDQMQFSNDATTWSTWEGFATSKAWTLSTGDGDKSVYVRYKDGGGNVSTIYNGTITLTEPETPAAIGDLRIRSGSATKNSVILDWTATGANGVIGTASSYDLRSSIQKIIEDGTTPADGEINFSNATQVTNVPTPKAAGSAESTVVTQLETNSVYYFAIKAVDEKGNVSAISNVINGTSVPPLPVTALRNGYTLVSFPLSTNATAQELLAGIVGSPVELYWWSSNGIGDDNGSFVAETNIVPGYGYFLKSNVDNGVLYITGTLVTDAARAIPLQPGWNIIGNPYSADVYLKNTYVRNIDTGELKSYEDAIIAGWVGNSLYIYNGSTYKFELYTDTKLKLWQGYWIAVLKDGQYEMVIYKP